MAAKALKSLNKAASNAIVKAQAEAMDAVHELLTSMNVDTEVIQAIDELKSKFTAGKPKRAKTGYNVFIAEHMKETKLEQPELKSVQHMKLACAAWKELDSDEQEKYKEMARVSAPDTTTDSESEEKEKPKIEIEKPKTDETEKPIAKAKAKKAKKTAVVVEEEEE